MIDAKAVLLMLKLVNHDLNTHISSPTDPSEVSHPTLPSSALLEEGRGEEGEGEKRYLNVNF